ncbi:hypothetical protein JDV02_005700 [Purpureocillium takamizusanense]|uniref:Uncharacterized protein n=1 Tax=Purpureocillium takamizusanense TaxID=2060973 RepID=A0A9Q8VBB8_9HYPO|nr:uncharacterized protein JDV02_005700 [Purpureocillium takamizusanense]UNI19518.1 hypothetical protein JDV02_005700 [Purpureocillium takamizusanense]
MATRIFNSRILFSSALVATATAGVYTALIYRRVSATPLSTITSANSVSESFAKSTTIRNLVNPRGYVALTDSRSVTLELPSRDAADDDEERTGEPQNPSDQVILASFVKGFFGGRVFALERIALGVLRLQAGPFPGLTTPEKPIWSTEELSNDALPPPSSTIFGAFRVAAIDIADASARDESIAPAESSTTSSVDVLYGSSEGQFAGCHRFSVCCEGSQVKLSLECVTCNPTVDKPLSPAIMFWFHRVYAMLLFRDALYNVRQVARLQ